MWLSRFVGIALVAHCLAGCSDDVGCSTDGAKELVVRLMKEQQANVAADVIDWPNAEPVFDSIRATEKTDLKNTCAAHVVLKAGLTDARKAALGYMKDNPKFPNYDPDRKSDQPFDIAYEVSKTDDGKLYVQIISMRHQ